MLRLVEARPDTRDLESWCAQEGLEAVDAHPFTGGFGRSYYPAVSGANRIDRSFCVMNADTPVALVLCTVGPGSFDWHGLPIEIFLSRFLADNQSKDVVNAIIAHLQTLLATADVKSSYLLDAGSAGSLSAVGEACLNHQWIASAHFTATCDLASGEKGLRTGLRKSFRSLVNWGRRNLRLVYVNGANPSPALFDDYRSFHHEVAGRVTRPQASWDAMFAWIAAGKGELSLGFLNDELVTATLVVDGTKTAYYASGVYDRARFDKPMAHFPLYDAILRAGARGKLTFDLGNIPQKGFVSPKELAIGYFKRGFAQHIVSSLLWTKTADNPPPPT